jgi:superfamily II DNA or RNA helicase
MWSVIPKQDFDKFLDTYHSKFVNIETDYILSENNSYYFLPRYFYRNFPYPTLRLTTDNNFVEKEINIEFTSSLRDEQTILINKINSIYNNNHCVFGIIKARPGFGKTVCSAYISCLLKLRTLIILDNSKLAEQWKDAFLQFTNISEDNIGLVKGSEFDVKDVTITMVQTLVSKCKNGNSEFYRSIRDAGFGLVIFDETHKTSSAPKFALSSLLLNSRNVLGLSATPFGDESHKLFMRNIIGNLIFESDNYDLKPEINFMNYRSGLGKKHYFRMSTTSDYIKQISFYNSIIHTSDPYLEIISRICKKENNNERKGIVIVQTLKQLNTIIDYLKSIGLNPTPLHSEKQEIDKEKNDLLVATYKMASHGFDFAELSYLILATPLKGRISLIQTIGRILRLTNNKKTPIVYDLVDSDFNNIFTKEIIVKKKIIETEFGDCKFTNISYDKFNFN